MKTNQLSHMLMITTYVLYAPPEVGDLIKWSHKNKQTWLVTCLYNCRRKLWQKFIATLFTVVNDRATYNLYTYIYVCVDMRVCVLVCACDVSAYVCVCLLMRLWYELRTRRLTVSYVDNVSVFTYTVKPG